MPPKTLNSQRKTSAKSPSEKLTLFAVRLDRNLVHKLRKAAKIEKRSTSKQVAFFLEQVLETR